MHDTARRWTPVSDGHVECVDDECGVLPRVERPTDDPLAERAHHRGTEHRPFPCRMLGDVGDPQIVWAQAVKLAIDQVAGSDHPA